MSENAEPDFSFVNDSMSAEEKIYAYHDAYNKLWQQGISMLESFRQEKIEWQKQEQFGIKVIEYIRKQLQYYQDKYPDDRPSITNENNDIIDSDAMIKQYESIYMMNNNMNNNNNNDSDIDNDDNNIDNTGPNKPNSGDPNKLRHELFLERRASEYLRQECDDLQNELQLLQEQQTEIVNVANNEWEKQLVNVFEQIAEQGHDIKSLNIDFQVENSDNNENSSVNESNNTDNNNNNNNNNNGKSTRFNLTGDKDTVTEVEGMRKNLVRLYTQTDWNAKDLEELKEEMMSQMQTLHKGTITKMTHNPNIMYNNNNNNNNNDNTNDINNNNNNNNSYNNNNNDELSQLKNELIKYQNLYKESEAKLTEMEREYSQQMLDNQEGIDAMKDIMNEKERECDNLQNKINVRIDEISRLKNLLSEKEKESQMLYESKLKFINSVSSEMQRLRDLIKLYNPSGKFRHIMDKIVRYHELDETNTGANHLFQLIEDNNTLKKETTLPRRVSTLN